MRYVSQESQSSIPFSILTLMCAFGQHIYPLCVGFPHLQIRDFHNYLNNPLNTQISEQAVQWTKVNIIFECQSNPPYVTFVKIPHLMFEKSFCQVDVTAVNVQHMFASTDAHY